MEFIILYFYRKIILYLQKNYTLFQNLQVATLNNPNHAQSHPEKCPSPGEGVSVRMHANH